jgi:putative tRNA adenosine deaminase-associated protein
VSYFAAAAVRGPKGWVASELGLSGAADVEEVADRLRDVDPDAELSLLFVESDDAYLVIMRLDGAEDLRVFGSDSVFAEESRLGALLLGDIETPALEIDDQALEIDGQALEAEEPAGARDGADGEERPAGEPDIDPVGDPDLLADLGISAHRLLTLCAHGGMLPSDITAELCQMIGCGDEIEELREA